MPICATEEDRFQLLAKTSDKVVHTLGEEESSFTAWIADMFSLASLSTLGERTGGSGAFLFIFLSVSCIEVTWSFKAELALGS